MVEIGRKEAEEKSKTEIEEIKEVEGSTTGEQADTSVEGKLYVFF